ncbi:MAG: M15 family metallopeptidase [Patescibacteria group bacterium]
MFNKLRVYYNVLLCRFGIRDILPHESIKKVRVLENNDFLVDISEDNSFVFAVSLKSPIYVRNEVYYKLKKATEMLPDGICLKIYDAYRPIEKQRESWEKALRETIKEKNNLPQEKIERLSRLKVADPSRGEYGGHQTGGAIDVIFCEKNGKELDLGTRVAEYNEKTKTKNSFLSEEVKRNRKLLKDSMTAVGFKNFPAEWWHFSYGDRLWAAYSRKKTCFYGFIKQKEFALLIQRGNIADGLNDIAKYLDLEPEKTVFVHSINNPQEKPQIDLAVYRHAKVLSYLPRKRKGAKALMLYVLRDLLNYLNEQGLALKNSLIQIERKPEKIAYPDISVVAQFYKAAKEKENVIEELRGKTLISSYPGQDERLLAELTGMKLLIQPEKQLEFNSKSRLRIKAREGGYNVLPGVEVYNLNELDKKITQLRKIVNDCGLNINTIKFWSKFDAQSDGKGTISFLGLDGDAIKKYLQYLSSFKNVSRFFPLIIEIDVNCLKNTKMVANVGVEAVISDKAVTLVGSAMQNTLNGRYIGSLITPDLEKYEFTAEATALPVFVGMQKEKYRGPITIDVLVAYNSKKGSHIGYNIDPNARFSGGMQLLSIVQYVREMIAKKYYGVSYFNAVKDSDNLFQNIKSYAAPYLYDGSQSQYEGILPLSVDDITRTKDNKRVVQVAVIGRDMLTIDKMYQHFKNNIIKALSSG